MIDAIGRRQAHATCLRMLALVAPILTLAACGGEGSTATTTSTSSSAIKVITSSYSLKSTPASGRPSTTNIPMGVFTQDYQYVANSGDLDDGNGRTGVTPEFPNGIYHYYITDTFPFSPRCWKGTIG